MQSNVFGKIVDAVCGRLLMFVLDAYGRLRRRLSRRYRADIGDLSIESILVIKLCCLGDGVLSLPSIRALKRRYPEAKLTMICTPRNADAFIGQDFIDEVRTLHLTGLGGMKEVAISAPAQLLRAIRTLRQLQPDIAVDLDLYFKVTPVLAFLSGAPIRAGFDTEGKNRGRLYTHSMPRDPDRHEVLCFGQIVESLGVPVTDMTLTLYEDPDAARSVEKHMQAAKIPQDMPYAVLAPGSSKNWPVKRWAVERFARLGQYLIDEYGMAVIAVGAEFEAELGRQAIDPISGPAANLAGITSIRETIELLRHAAIVISNDSGPMHLAAAVDVPVIGIFGPTNPRKWRPWSDSGIAVTAQNCCERAPCYYLSRMPACEAEDCLGRIKVDDLKAAVDRLIKKHQTASEVHVAER